MESDTSPALAGEGPTRPSQPNQMAWISVVAVAVAALSIFLGFFVALIAVVLGHIGRALEPSARHTSTLALVIGYASVVLHGLFLLGMAILAHSFANSNWQF
jgi:hypothetical protein